jgi:hypothetical protein
MATKKVAVLQVGPGIQRDGTPFASSSYIDGEWVRFQYGKPRKIGGYNGAFLNAPGISRGVILNSQNGQTWVISGFSNGIQQWTINNNQAIGTGPIPVTISGPLTLATIVTSGLGYTNGTYTGVPIVTGSGVGSGATLTVVVSSNRVTSLTVSFGGANYIANDTFLIPAASMGGLPATQFVTTGVVYTVTTTGTTTLPQWQAYFNTLTSLPSVGNVITATATGTIAGTGTVTPTYGTFTGAITGNLAYSSSSNALWQMDIGYDAYGTGNNNLLAHPGDNLTSIDSIVNTRPLIGEFTGTNLTAVGVFSQTGTLTSGSKLVTFATTNVAIGAGVSVTGTYVPANTTVVSSNLNQYGTIGTVAINTVGSAYTNGTFTNVAIVGGSGVGTGGLATVVVASGAVSSVTVTAIGAGYLFEDSFTLPSLAGGSGFTGTIKSLATITSNLWTATLSNAATGTGSQTLNFDNNISISGGIVMLYPYLFAYGNNGLIQNCAAGNFNDWVSADANANNVAANKIVKGLPLRGGTTSPSGLFWSLDSVIRVTYAPQNVGNATLYWRYDLISSQSSIMSSSCVIEYDGIFYWIGVDRFLMYNGVVQEVPNTQNMNWFFDGINLAQRQKVWASKVPRWGEIWWFYPRGTATECNDAIIYNIREKCWYDAGLATGANRSAGYFSDVFTKPIWADNVTNSTGQNTLWIHESGVNQTSLTNVNAINSSFETNVLGAAAGLVGNAQGSGDNLWTRVDRVEPDFIQNEHMSLIVTGKGYADDTDIASDPYLFTKETLKIDMKEQRREMRLKFISNTVNGDYFMGRIVLNIETGDVRGTGNP